MGQWGWKLFARKGQRNIAVAAVARKLAVQAWHLLSGNPPETLEPSKTLELKLHKLAVTLGKPLRKALKLPPRNKDCIRHFHQLILSPTNPEAA